jgi:hypothetical protein
MSGWNLSEPVRTKLVEMTILDRSSFVLDFGIPSQYRPQPDPAGEWVLAIDRQCGLRGISDSDIREWLIRPPRNIQINAVDDAAKVKAETRSACPWSVNSYREMRQKLDEILVAVEKPLKPT